MPTTEWVVRSTAAETAPKIHSSPPRALRVPALGQGDQALEQAGRLQPADQPHQQDA